jgi:hypothetical protein
VHTIPIAQRQLPKLLHRLLHPLLFRFNVHEEFGAMNLKPLCNVVCRKLGVDNAKARCTHICDQLLLPSEVHDEASH